jgi:hypothetical protein
VVKKASCCMIVKGRGQKDSFSMARRRRGQKSKFLSMSVKGASVKGKKIIQNTLIRLWSIKSV